MSLARRVFIAAKSTAAMAVQLARATGRPDQAAHFALRYLSENDEPVLLDWQGLRICARRKDWFALKEVLIEREYAALVPFLQRKRAPVVLDLGANIGAFGLFAIAAAPGAIVHSFEPSEATFNLLAENAARNPCCQWHAHRAAAWREDGVITFANADASTSGRISDSGSETVPAVSLASIIERCGGRVDIAKIDIEGAEDEAVAGRSEELSRIETLVVELHADRCDTTSVIRTIENIYPTLQWLTGRASSKPLLLATRATCVISSS